MKRALLVFTLVALVATVYAGDPVEVWNKVYDGGHQDMAMAVAVDALGNVYVTGLSTGPVDADYRVIKYDPDGNHIWTRLYDGGRGHDQSWNVAVDALANVYVTGNSHNGDNYDCRTICYDSEGNILWNKVFDGDSTDAGYGVAVGASGNVYVTGSSHNGDNDDFHTICYDSGGNILWNTVFDGDSSDYGAEVAVDASGYVYATGWSNNGTDNDCRTICYDSEGNILWNEVFDGDRNDRGLGLALDASGYVYVTGDSENPRNTDCRTICYDSEGNVLSNWVFDDDSSDAGTDVAVDDYFVYVMCTSNNGTDDDFRTIRYDKVGNIGWNVIFDSDSADIGHGIAVDDSHYVYVTGYSLSNGLWDMRTIKYDQYDYPGIAETPTPSPLALEVVDNLSSTPTLRYAIPAGSTGTLSFYSVDGRVIESFSISSSQSIFAWDARNTPSGVYFARLVAAHQSVTVKTILVR